jgi:hemolysin activation/secretion protein
MTLSGQWAGNNLNSSEKYSLGGVYGVRAYPQGEASGDMGSMLNLELAHNFTPQLRGVLFYDYGHIRINRDRFLATDNARTLAGAGLGVNASLYGWQLDSYLAWPLQGGTPLSEPASSERIPRLWMQMSGEF